MRHFILSIFLLTFLYANALATMTKPTILILGDSLSAAYGIAIEESWVSLLQQQLIHQQFPHQIINASISGETTAGGASRIKALIKEHQPKIIIVELGGNDGLRGIPIPQIEQNLRKIIEVAKKHQVQVILTGMQIPPNYGPRYSQSFSQLFFLLAKEYQSFLIANFLEGIGDKPMLMQSDGIHPTAAAQPLLLEKVWQVLKRLL